MDIALAIEYLGLNNNEYLLNQNNSPNQLVEWLGPDPRPTDAELETAWSAFKPIEALRQLRDKRNLLLAETDWWANSDLTMTSEQTAYRTALRDLPSTSTPSLNDGLELTGVAWPTKP